MRLCLLKRALLSETITIAPYTPWFVMIYDMIVGFGTVTLNFAYLLTFL